MALEPHFTEDSLNGRDNATFAPTVITPPKQASRGPLSGLTGWPSCPEAQSGAPGGSRFDQTSEAVDYQRCVSRFIVYQKTLIQCHTPFIPVL